MDKGTVKKKEPFSFRARARSFRYAFAGIALLLRMEHNAWIHFTVAVCVATAGFLLHLSAAEWVAVVILTGGVLAAEAFNSAIERLCDQVSPEYCDSIKQVKDLAAAGVLLMAIAAATAGLIIFVPKLIELAV